MSDEWLDQLRQLHEADKAQREAEAPPEPEPPPPSRASELLRQSEAHQHLREIQKVLLNGGGTLDIFDRASDYERVVTLAWQGPISAARKPDPDDPEPYHYILVGVRKDKLWVNGQSLPNAQPETLKAALLEACKKPGREKNRK
ncbi:MAG: hypothetical protein JW953_04825 [Anaerolineae bacterium]|nr:hypothetical protein [Anaerolineae bacterium]